MLETLSIFNRLLNYRERRSFWILLGMILFEAILEIVSVSMIPAYVTLVAYPDRFTVPGAMGDLLERMLAGMSHHTLIVWASVALCLFFVFKLLMNVLGTYWKARYAQNRAIKFSSRLYQAYMYAPYTFHLQNNSSELMRNINMECMQLAARVLTPLVELLSNAIIFTAILLVLMWYVPFSTFLLLLALLAIAAVIVLKQKKSVRAYGQEAQHCRGQVIKHLNEGLMGIKEIRLLNRAAYFVRHFSTSFTRLMEIQRYIQVLSKSIPGLVELITIIGLLGIVLLLFSTETSPEKVLPVVAIYAVALARMKGTLSSIMHNYNEIQHNQASLRVVYDGLTQLGADTTQPALLRKPLPFERSLQIHGVSYRYPQAHSDSLCDIHLEIRKGEAVGFVGSTGAGKSTLIDLILGVLEPTMGRIHVDGTDIRVSLSAWQAHIGYVPQMIYLLDGTIRQNIALGLEAHEIDEAAIQRAVRDACLEDVVEKSPRGLDTVIGEKGVKLSGGQRQRVAIARAIYADPRVLVLDEGTSALDNATEREVMRAVEGMRGRRTILIIAHRLSTVANCDRIVFLENGRIEAIGPYAELVATHDGFRDLAHPS